MTIHHTVCAGHQNEITFQGACCGDGSANGKGGLYRTTDRGAHWAKINTLDRVTSITFSPTNSNDAFLTTETDGLWHSGNIHAASPLFTLVSNYPFRQPERVFFNPYNANEIWVTSFGNGLMVGNLTATPVIAPSNAVITITVS